MKSKNKCIILLTNQIKLNKVLKDYKNFDYIVCETGALYAFKNKLNIVAGIGDLDSVSLKERKLILNKIPNFKIFESEKLYTDSELAINLAIEMQYEEVHLIESGDRADHHYNHIKFLYKYKNINLHMWDSCNHVFLLKKGKNFTSKNCLYISCFTDSTDSLSTKNFKYEIKNKELKTYDTFFTSNEIKQKKDLAYIESKSGTSVCFEYLKIKN